MTITLTREEYESLVAMATKNEADIESANKAFVDWFCEEFVSQITFLGHNGTRKCENLVKSIRSKKLSDVRITVPKLHQPDDIGGL